MTKEKDTRRDAWNFDYLGLKAYGTTTPRKYHDWVYMADDSMNKVLKTVVVALHVYGLWVFLQALWEKYI
jgi:hypothetical protein